MKKSFLCRVALCLLPLLFLVASRSNADIPSRSESINMLDREVAMSHVYVEKQEKEIQRLKGNLRVATTYTDKYLSLKQIVQAYSKFDSDSALVYLRKCQSYGVKYGNEEWVQEAIIHEAYVYADRGDDYASTVALEKIGGFDRVLPSLRPFYAKTTLIRYLKYENSPQPYTPRFDGSDSVWLAYSPYLSKQDPFFYMISYYYHAKKPKNDLEKPLRALMKHIGENTNAAAIAHFSLYNILEQEGKQDEAFHQLVLTAICDIRCANRSSSALLLLLETLSHENACMDIIPQWLNLCHANASLFKDVGRSIRLLKVQQQIQNIRDANGLRTYYILWAVIVLLVIVGFFPTYLYIRARKVSNRHAEKYARQDELLQRMGKELEDRKREILSIQKQNKLHTDKDRNSDGMLIKSFTLWSHMLRDTRLHNKEIANLLQTGMQRKAKDMVLKTIAQDQSMNVLLRWFDAIFLSLHPRFVEQFNEVLRPECQVLVDDSQSLTPELRIYALVSLGVHDSTTIAEILQYSPQTVYNYRLKMRHSTKIEKFDLKTYIAELYDVKD